MRIAALVTFITSLLTCSTAGAYNITLQLIADGGRIEEYRLQSGQPFLLDLQRTQSYSGFIGCTDIDTSGLPDHMLVGRRIQIPAVQFTPNHTMLHVTYNCVIHNISSASSTYSPTIVLRQHAPYTLPMPSGSGFQKMVFLLN